MNPATADATSRSSHVRIFKKYVRSSKWSVFPGIIQPAPFNSHYRIRNFINGLLSCKRDLKVSNANSEILELI